MARRQQVSLQLNLPDAQIVRGPALWVQLHAEDGCFVTQRWRFSCVCRSCVDLHPGYEYMLWTDAASEQFIAQHFPWFLATYRAYPYVIQRVDAIRYFILYHYGEA